MQTSLLEQYWVPSPKGLGSERIPKTPGKKILSNNMEEEIKVYSKKEYMTLVQDKRKEFVCRHFKERLVVIFKTLEEDASKMKSCHREISFEVPEYFDIDKTEIVLSAFFTDLGYKVLTEARKPKDVNIFPIKISFTLT